MTMQYARARQYQEVEFATADRGRILLAMYDGGLRFLTGAKVALEAGDYDAFGHNLGRTQAIVAELLHTLDHEVGGEIAANLDRLYRFLLEHLIEANLQKSARHVVDAQRILGIVADGYRQILAQGLPAELMGNRSAA